MTHQFRRPITRASIGIALIILIAGCGTNSGSKTVGSTLTSTAFSTRITTPKPTPEMDVVTPLPPQGISFNVANMFIYSVAGIQCKYRYVHPIPLDLDDTPTLPHGTLVLTSDQLTYDSGTIQQMKDYVTAFYNHNGSLPPLPSTLSWLSASSVCQLHIDITNRGNSPIQIQTTNVQFNSVPQPNLMQYRLVDICSLVVGSFCPPQGAGGAGIFYQFHLGNGNAGTVFSPSYFSSIVNNQSSDTPIPFTIFGGDAVGIDMAFDSPSNSIYSITPDLVLSTNDGSQTIMLSQLSGTLFTADASQFSCYQLQSITFVPEALSPGNSCV